MRGRRRIAACAQSGRFHRLWNSFQAIWKAINVLPVPVASVRRMRSLAVGDGFEHALDGDVLIVAALEVAAAVFERDGGEAIAPGVLLGERAVPKFFGRRIASNVALGAFVHVDGVDALAVGGVSEADGEFARVVLGLAEAFGDFLSPRLWPRSHLAWCCDISGDSRR